MTYSTALDDSLVLKEQLRLAQLPDPSNVLLTTLIDAVVALEGKLGTSSFIRASRGFADTSSANTGGTFAPATGGTVTIGTIGNNVSTVYVLPTGAITIGNLTMPTTPIDGLLLTVVLGPTNLVTTLNLLANAGQTVNVGAITAAVDTSYQWIYRSSGTTWYRVR